MAFEADLRFLQATFQKCNINTALIDPLIADDFRNHDILREHMREDSPFNHMALFEAMRPRTVYKLTDPFLCSYVLLELPNTETGRKILAIGPYLSVEMSRQQLLEQAESAGVSPASLARLESFYGSLPVVTQAMVIFAPLEVFCESIWGEDYSVVDINREAFYSDAVPSKDADSVSSAELGRRMKEMELRYAKENEMLRAVAKGQIHKLERMISGFSQLSFEHRLADPIRNQKNYMIVTNTLLRKAVEEGGVHPLYIDSTSSAFATRIEGVTSLSAARELLLEMFSAYCLLVRKHNTVGFSPQVQRAILHIESDLSADLSLQKLADIQNINASYLSALFKKETGENLTDYIRGKRIAQAVHLLSTTKLQVQTVAQYCGIPDVNYFSKVFKSQTGKTPKEYRAENFRRISAKK